MFIMAKLDCTLVESCERIQQITGQTHQLFFVGQTIRVYCTISLLYCQAIVLDIDVDGVDSEPTITVEYWNGRKAWNSLRTSIPIQNKLPN